jgi:hypothetical protein
MADPVLKARAAALFRKLVEQDRRDALAQVIGGPAGPAAATQILPIQ